MTDLFDFNPPPLKFAVMGNPVAHSRSPQIHAQFAAEFGIRLEYQPIQVNPGGFLQALRNFQAAGGSGLNVTVPFKIEAWQAVDRRARRAERAGAVNTITLAPSGVLVGNNTDGAGLVRDLEVNLGLALAGRAVLVAGAGGAVCGILESLLAAEPATLLVVNRTVDKAVALVERFAGSGAIDAGGYQQARGRRFDLVINGTASSLAGEVPPLPPGVFTAGALAYDLMYADRPTPFMAWALAQGAARASDGLGMLVEQAAEAFFIWHGRHPATAPVRASLRPAA